MFAFTTFKYASTIRFPHSINNFKYIKFRKRLVKSPSNKFRCLNNVTRQYFIFLISSCQFHFYIFAFSFRRFNSACLILPFYFTFSISPFQFRLVNFTFSISPFQFRLFNFDLSFFYFIYFFFYFALFYFALFNFAFAISPCEFHLFNFTFSISPFQFLSFFILFFISPFSISTF